MPKNQNPDMDGVSDESLDDCISQCEQCLSALKAEKQARASGKKGSALGDFFKKMLPLLIAILSSFQGGGQAPTPS